MTPAEVADWTTASRRAQRLPERIEDPAVLGRVATLAFAATVAEGGDRRGPPGGDETGRPPAKTDARPDTPVRASSNTLSPAPQIGQDRKPVLGGGGRAR